MSGGDNQSKPSFWVFWKTLPGIITAVTGLIAAVTGLIIALNGAGLLSGGENKSDREVVQARNLIVIGGKKFLESSILVEMMAVMISQENRKVPVVRNYRVGETSDLLNGLISGVIDIYPEYTGTLLSHILHRPSVEVREEKFHEKKVINKLLEANKSTSGLIWMSRLGFSNSFVMVMLREKAKRLGIANGDRVVTLSSLANSPKKLRVKASFAFYNRPDGFPGLKKEYALKFDDLGSIDHKFKYESLLRDDMDITDGYETDSQLNWKETPFIRIKDDKKFFPKYYAAPFLRKGVIERFPHVKIALEKLRNEVVTKDISALIREGLQEGLDKANLNESVTARSMLQKIVLKYLAEKGLAD